MRNWRRSSNVALVVVIVFIVFQVTVPLTRIGSDVPERFGWKMFSAAEAPVEFTVHTASGEEIADLGEILARHRGELPLTETVPPFLCENTPGATRVSWEGGNLNC
ncbi:MAG: hypothetical protein WBM90_06905 [Acidimicrobiia bacterium]